MSARARRRLATSHATCANTQGDFTCTCGGGYEGSGASCTDVDECATGADDCDSVASCTNTGGGFTCQCPAGYADTNGDGSLCTDLCDLAMCDSEATCTIEQGHAACHCPPGFIDVNGDGKQCELDVECQTLACDENAECVIEQGSPACACKAGYEDLNDDGSDCREIDECDGAARRLRCATRPAPTPRAASAATVPTATRATAPLHRHQRVLRGHRHLLEPRHLHRTLRATTTASATRAGAATA